MKRVMEVLTIEEVVRDTYLPSMSRYVGRHVELFGSPVFERIDGEYVALFYIYDEPTISAQVRIPADWLETSQRPIDVIHLLDRQLRYVAKRLRASLKEGVNDSSITPA